MKLLKCWRCLALYALTLPPLMAYLVWQRWAKDEDFETALKKLEGGLAFMDRMRRMAEKQNEPDQKVRSS